MPLQPNLFKETEQAPEGRAARPVSMPNTASDARKTPAPHSRVTATIFAAEFLLSVTVRIFVGVVVLVLPWSPLWDSNHFLQVFPRVGAILSLGATRGIISGLGILNLWIAVHETLHRSDRKL